MMIAKRVSYSVLLTAVLSLTGCQYLDSGQTTAPVVVVPPKQQPSEDVVTFPKQQQVDWTASLEQVVQKMVAASGSSEVNYVLIDDITNRSKNHVDTNALTQQYKSLLDSTYRFSTVDEATLSDAKRALGIEQGDSLSSRAKSVGLSRYLKIPYVLYTSIIEKGGQSELNVQMLQVNSGEVIWSAKSPLLLD